MTGWSEFYAVIGAASATLLGLLFVAISMNAAVILGGGRPTLERQAEQAFQNYLTVLMVALVELLPDTSAWTFGVVTLCLIAVSAGWLLVRAYLAFITPEDRGLRFQAMRRYSSSLVGFGMIIYAAIRLILHQGDPRTTLASGAIVLLLSATTVSWQLLFRVALANREARH